MWKSERLLKLLFRGAPTLPEVFYRVTLDDGSLVLAEHLSPDEIVLWLPDIPEVRPPYGFHRVYRNTFKLQTAAEWEGAVPYQSWLRLYTHEDLSVEQWNRMAACTSEFLATTHKEAFLYRWTSLPQSVRDSIDLGQGSLQFLRDYRLEDDLR